MEQRARFEALYREHAGAVRAYARRRIETAAADDVVSEVFLTAWRRLPDAPEDPLPWLLGIARRMIANRRRGEARAAALRSRLASATPREPAGEPGGAGLDRPLEAALRALSERDREVLLLVAWDQLEPARAARALGISRGTFAVRLYRARRRVTKLLADENERPATAEVS